MPKFQFVRVYAKEYRDRLSKYARAPSPQIVVSPTEEAKYDVPVAEAEQPKESVAEVQTLVQPPEQPGEQPKEPVAEVQALVQPVAEVQAPETTQPTTQPEDEQTLAEDAQAAEAPNKSADDVKEPPAASYQISQNEAAAYTLKQLQTVCIDHNIVSRGTKADLRQRLVQANIIV